MKKIIQTRTQQAAGVITLVAVAVLIIVGIQVFSSFDTTATSLATSTNAPAAVGNVTSNTYAAFNLVSVAPIIIAAVVILGIVALLYMRTR